MKNVMTILMLVAVVGLVAGPASGAAIYEADFETPTFTTGTIAGQDGWEVTAGTVTVTDNASYVISGSQSMLADASSAHASCKKTFAAQTGYLETEWTFNTLGNINRYTNFYVGSETGRALYMRVTYGNIQVYNGTSETTLLSGCGATTDYTIKMVVADISQHKFNLYVNGVSKASNFSFNVNTDSIDRFRMTRYHYSGENCKTAVDNMAVTTAVYDTGFETPTFTTGNINGQDGWAVTAGTVTVTNNASYVISGSQSMLADASSAHASCKKTFAAQTGKFEAEWTFNTCGNINRYTNFYIGTETGTALYMRVTYGNIQVYNGTSETTLMEDCGATTDYTIKVVVADVSQHKFDLYINGTIEAEDYSFNGDIDEIDRFRMTRYYYAGENCKTAVDGLVILPEPATMVLLGLGSVGLLIRRRRRA